MATLERKICHYISSEWISKEQVKSQFALNHNIDEKTVRRIVSDKSYKISLYTLNKICEARGIKLSEFFQAIDK
ncbi:helix-turn-helix transcriptional regulator [Aestuariibaculum sp. M13]|uniref:helix-turn-helix transcriptional regulator n=1 Tax=Aestuariibaculum sp. M13 TaxID=2967132 RepID=UPI002159FB53|nr:helix-turn-helix transcriptional regulator [Aestuariibaculum sp. M13]MCR8668241.1 helix-turn-helix transcriptional regulator [Aestuariibaculum sp. M13]